MALKKSRESKSGAHAPEVNRHSGQTVKRLPKLSIAVACACHLILAVRSTTAGGDGVFFQGFRM